MQNKVLIVAAGVLALLGVFAGYRYYASAQFAATYEAYAALAAAHSESAFAPATKGNQLRQELNLTLARALSDESLSNAERFALAERGLGLLDAAEKQIDAIGEAGKRVEDAIAAMEGRASSEAERAIVALAREHFSVIADIRGLSYRANFDTAEVFNRIVKEGGKLTNAHVRALNDALPQLEEQFDQRTNLYADLERVNSRMEAAYAELGMF